MADRETIETLTNRMTIADERIRHLEEQLEIVRTQATLEAKLELAQVAIEKTEERALRLEQHILKENSKPRNITMNLAPYCSPEELARICSSEYGLEQFNKGPEATYQFLLENCLKDSAGRPRVKCTDSSRRVFKGVNPTGEPFTDVGGQKIAKDVARPMKSAIRGVSNQVDDLDDYNWAKRTSSHYRVLEPSRLSKRLARDLVGGAVST